MNYKGCLSLFETLKYFVMLEITPFLHLAQSSFSVLSRDTHKEIMNKSGKSQGLKDIAREPVEISLQLAFVYSLRLQNWFSKWQSHSLESA